MSEQEAPDYAWADRLAADRATVLHLPTGYVGRVSGFALEMLAIPGTDKMTERPVPILHFERGDTLHADDQEKFHRLSGEETELFGAALEVVTGAVAELAKWAASRGVSQPIFEQVVARVLSQQVQTLRAGK